MWHIKSLIVVQAPTEISASLCEGRSVKKKKSQTYLFTDIKRDYQHNIYDKQISNHNGCKELAKDETRI